MNLELRGLYISSLQCHKILLLKVWEYISCFRFCAFISFLLLIVLLTVYLYYYCFLFVKTLIQKCYYKGGYNNSCSDKTTNFCCLNSLYAFTCLCPIIDCLLMDIDSVEHTCFIILMLCKTSTTICTLNLDNLIYVIWTLRVTYITVRHYNTHTLVNVILYSIIIIFIVV